MVVAGQEPRSYEKFIEEEAKLHGTDGCTFATDWQVFCCWEHDLACELQKDPRDAYKKYLYGLSDYWACAIDMSRRDADKMFASCNLRKSKGFVGTSRSLFRFVGVRLGALLPPY